MSVPFDDLPKTPSEALRIGSVFYFTGKPCPKGHVARRYAIKGSCTLCDKDNQQRNWARRDKEASRKRHVQYCRNNVAKTMLYSARHRAKNTGLEFNITEKDIVIPTHCPILGIELTVGKHRKQRSSPSLDRIDNSKGYIKGNIQVISDRANSIKNDATPEELEKVYKYMKALNDRIR